MEIKAGYKNTEIGIIPEDWKIVRLGDIASIKDGTHQTPKYTSFGVPFYSVEQVTSGNFSDTKYISPEEHKFLTRSCKIERGDILMTRIGSIGDCKLINWEVDASFYVSLALLKIHGASAHYVEQYSKSPLFQSEVELHSLASAIPKKINLGPISDIRLPIPPLEEQNAIATTLSEMDFLMGGLDRLIFKKRAIKQSTMQQLLTCQNRLPGFKGEWKVKRLGDHLNFLKNGVNSRAELSYSEDVRYLHYGDIHGSSRVVLNPTIVEMPCLPRAKASRLDRLQDGDLIYADASENRDGIGKSVEIQNATGVELVAGLHTIAIRFDKNVLADGFKAYIQFIPEFRSHLRQLAAGTKVYATNRAHIASAELRLPRIDEQRAISSLLTDMDTEIATLEARRTKTRALKQAMMQELLTGRTRLV